MWNIFFQQLVGQTTYNIMATVSGVGGSTSIHILATVSGTGMGQAGGMPMEKGAGRGRACTLRAIGKRPSHPSLAPSKCSEL